jgi:hypothetical protein
MFYVWAIFCEICLALDEMMDYPFNYLDLQLLLFYFSLLIYNYWISI